ncbi:MAG: YbaK/EbsC family protein [Acidimicrobiia bacterium]|nr:YbaK/EbsC family protein [Acidimicrobiia bacterium]
METSPGSTQRLLVAAAALGLPPIELHHFPEGTKTAQDAAGAIGCSVAMIVKSLVFVVDDHPVLALVPGDLRLDTNKLASVAGGQRATRAPLDLVREATGYVAGGTPPFGHARSLPIFADQKLARHGELWAAGGTPSTVFSISHNDLLNVTGATVCDITE